MEEFITEYQEMNAEAAQQAAKDAMEQKEAQLSAQLSAQTNQMATMAQAELAKLQQALADIPAKIEEKIDEIKKQFEKLLGKIYSEITDPKSPKFDVNAIMAKIKKLLTPLLSTTAPIASVAGKIPIIGDILKMLITMSAQAKPSSGLTEEDIKKAVPSLPEIPPAIMKTI